MINEIVDLRALTSIKVCADVGTILITLISLMVSSGTQRFMGYNVTLAIWNGQYRSYNKISE